MIARCQGEREESEFGKSDRSPEGPSYDALIDRNSNCFASTPSLTYIGPQMDNSPIDDGTSRVRDRNVNLKVLLAGKSEVVLEMSSSET